MNIEKLFATYIPEDHLTATETVEALVENRVTSLVRERLEVCFGGDLNAIHLTSLLIYLAECQFLNNTAETYDDYFLRDRWTISHKTHLKINTLTTLKNKLKDLGILEVRQDKSYQASCRYRIAFDELEEFLASKEDLYIAYFDELNEHEEEFNETKERVIKENKRKNLRKQFGKTNIWNTINQQFINDDSIGLAYSGLSMTEIYLFRAIQYGLDIYQHQELHSTHHFYNEVMAELSGYSYNEAKDKASKEGGTAEEIRENAIKNKVSLFNVIESFNPRNCPWDPENTVSLETKFLVGYRNARKKNEEYVSKLPSDFTCTGFHKIFGEIDV